MQEIRFEVGQTVKFTQPHAYPGEVLVVAISTDSICVQLSDYAKTLLCYYQERNGQWTNGRGTVVTIEPV